MGRADIADHALRAKRSDGRRHQRVTVPLTGRCMFEDRSEVACHIVDMSVGGVALSAPAVGALRERVVAYVDQIGRIEGRIVRHFVGGFALAYSVSEGRRDKLADQLTWIANRAVLGLPEDRRHTRVVPSNPWSKLVFDDGSELRCRILDVSTSGAAVRADVRPPLGARVLLGRMSGRVVRHASDSVGIEFATNHSETLIRRVFA